MKKLLVAFEKEGLITDNFETFLPILIYFDFILIYSTEFWLCLSLKGESILTLMTFADPSGKFLERVIFFFRIFQNRTYSTKNKKLSLYRLVFGIALNFPMWSAIHCEHSSLTNFMFFWWSVYFCSPSKFSFKFVDSGDWSSVAIIYDA